MDIEELIIINPDSRQDFREVMRPIPAAVWEPFLHQDPIANRYWDGLYQEFSCFQFGLMRERGQKPAALVNSVPLFWGDDLEQLPDEGWDWALGHSRETWEDNQQPNLLCGLQISIHPDFQRRGLSSRLLKMMVDLARDQGLTKVIIPVRPSWKSRYPLQTMESYLTWMNPDGMPYDPWLRVHVRAGGEIKKICSRAMYIPGTVADWEDWTGRRFFESGKYIIPGGLNPVWMDLENDQGLYVEPNVWVVHDV